MSRVHINPRASENYEQALRPQQASIDKMQPSHILYALVARKVNQAQLFSELLSMALELGLPRVSLVLSSAG